jgi:beta-xylosidase
MLATDMKSSLGWNSNRNLLSAKSTDLVHWFDETSIEIANKYSLMQGADRAWAPQAIYDPEKESYMIYFAARVPGRDDRTIMYYAYSKDMKRLDTEPQLLFAPKNGNDAIDSDIIFENGKYYMYYKNETNKRIYLAESEHANGPYAEIKQVSEGNIGVEGPNIYKKIGTDKWLMMSDAYGNGYYQLETSDGKVAVLGQEKEEGDGNIELLKSIVQQYNHRLINDELR